MDIGEEIGRYEIRKKIGAGGMGEVYLVEDKELDRLVALKVLHSDIAADDDRVRRFIQEAKAASALNHPNILTVHEIGSRDDTRFITTEYIKGITLRDRLNGEPQTLREILDAALQVAAALNAAHDAGIVHRDIKPENIMLRDDGLVKVLDFGLAKLLEPGALATGSEVASEDATRAQVNTRPGMVMGTVAYMSPEQARGLQTDARSDIWSLGVVIYEMLAKQTPFAGETPNDSIAAILTKDPPPLNENTPAELQRIIRKSLQKRADERYQTIKDLLLDVKNLKRELEFSEELERSQIPAFARATNVAAGQTGENATSMSGVRSSGGSFADPTIPSNGGTQNLSSAEYIVSEIKGHKKSTTAILAVLLVALVGGGYWFWGNRNVSTRQIESIAVMPFVNDSGNSEGEYLSDGMTETLINSLSQIPNLSVKARSSVFRYKGKEIDPKKVASELGVQAILTGRVIQRGDQLILSVELIDGLTENTIWGNKYERKASDLVALQTEVARDVSSKLKSKLSNADTAKVTKAYTTNTEAYQLYLKGRFNWNRRTTESLKQAADFFKQAIEKDPNYALAYSGLAETYVLFSAYSVGSTKDTMPQAKAAAQRALELDDSLAAPHATLGAYLIQYEWDRVGGEREYRRAIELDPNYATAHQWFATDVLGSTKRFDEALTELRRAEELDPLSPIIGTNLGDTLVNARRYDEGIAQYKRVLSLDPNFAYAHQALGWAYGFKGMYPEAIAETRKCFELNQDPQAQGYLGLWLARSGARGEAMKLLDQLKQESTQHYVPGYSFALIYIGLNEKEEALSWLEKDVTDRSPNTVNYGIVPELDDLRSDPRFKDMLKRLNLPE